jgi:hypothetical protein
VYCILLDLIEIHSVLLGESPKGIHREPILRKLIVETVLHVVASLFQLYHFLLPFQPCLQFLFFE